MSEIKFCTCFYVIWIAYYYSFRRKPAILVSIVFHLPTIIHRISLQRYTVRTFIILIIVKSLGFGSNNRYYLFFLTIGLSTHILASNVNLVTHYAKGTFLLIYLLELLIKLLFHMFPHGTFRCRLYIVFSLWGRFPIYSNNFLFILLFLGYSVFVHTNNRISFDLFS